MHASMRSWRSCRASRRHHSRWATGHHYRATAARQAVTTKGGHVEPAALTWTEMTDYRDYLAVRYPKLRRIWSVARQICKEQTLRGLLSHNPGEDIKGFKVDNEITHTVLAKGETADLLGIVDRSTVKGCRDYTMQTSMTYGQGTDCSRQVTLCLIEAWRYAFSQQQTRPRIRTSSCKPGGRSTRRGDIRSNRGDCWE